MVSIAVYCAQVCLSSRLVFCPSLGPEDADYTRYKELTRSGTGAGRGWQCDGRQLSLEPPHDPLHLVEVRVDVVAEQRQHCGHGGGSQ